MTAWADALGEPWEADRDRLRHPYHAAALLRERYDATNVQSWFKGMNPSLGDQAPARPLREREPLAVAGDVYRCCEVIRIRRMSVPDLEITGHPRASVAGWVRARHVGVDAVVNATDSGLFDGR